MELDVWKNFQRPTNNKPSRFNFWDKDAKIRIKASSSIGDAIPSTSYNRDGRIFAYAVSYDWSRGHEHSKQGQKHRILLYSVKDEDTRPRIQKKSGVR